MSGGFVQNRTLITGLCLLVAIGALFLAQLPNDTRSDWFRSLNRPEFLPRSLEKKIGLIWTSIFLLAGVGTSTILISSRAQVWKVAQILLMLTAFILNLNYTYTFTQKHDLVTATWISGGLALVLTTLVGMCLIGRFWLATACHVPHLAWVCFATIVTDRMAALNP